MRLLQLEGVLLGTLLLAGAGWAAADNSCIDCHQSEDFYTRQPSLYRYYRDWVQSGHSEAGVTCDDCHGGDPSAPDREQAHAGVYPLNDEESTLHFTRQPATCGSCHQENRTEFESSKHYRALMSEQATAPTCTTCHPAMNKRPGYHSIVLNSCTSCHGEGNRQGLPPVVKEAETLLRHVNMASGLLGWSSLHYQELQWPGDSREHVSQLEQRYRDLVTRIHRFDLAASEKDAVALLDELQAMFYAEKKAAAGKKAVKENSAD